MVPLLAQLYLSKIKLAHFNFCSYSNYHNYFQIMVCTDLHQSWTIENNHPPSFLERAVGKMQTTGLLHASLRWGKVIRHSIILPSYLAIFITLQHTYENLTFHFTAIFDSNMKQIVIKLESNLKCLSGFLKSDTCD